MKRILEINDLRVSYGGIRALDGISLNVEPDLEHFGGIVPCGIREHGVTSLWDLGITATMDEVDAALRGCWGEVFEAS